MGTYTLVASATREGFTSSREFMLSECITLVDIIMWQSCCCCCRYISSGNISLLYTSAIRQYRLPSTRPEEQKIRYGNLVIFQIDFLPTEYNDQDREYDRNRSLGMAANLIRRSLPIHVDSSHNGDEHSCSDKELYSWKISPTKILLYNTLLGKKWFAEIFKDLTDFTDLNIILLDR